MRVEDGGVTVRDLLSAEGSMEAMRIPKRVGLIPLPQPVGHRLVDGRFSFTRWGAAFDGSRGGRDMSDLDSPNGREHRA